MESENTRKEITELIVKGKIETALKELSTHLEGTDDHNTVILLLSQYSDLSRQTRMNTISPGSAMISRNRIINSILGLLSELEAEMEEKVKPQRKPAPRDKRKKLALVIGCSEYEHASELRNPVNDAKGIRAELEDLGFTVSIRENPDLKELKMAVDDFGLELQQDFDVGLFYFAGHGIQVNGINYLIPKEANLLEERYAEYDCLRADRVLMGMEKSRSKVNIVILDACRNNPFERSWGRDISQRGLAFMDAPKGSFIAYATSPGKTASDGEEENGLYTGELIRFIGEKQLSITQLFQKVRKSVMDISNDRQIPWDATSLTADFYFNP